MKNLRFFVDHCIPNFVITALRDAGYEVLRLRDYILPDSPDAVVISKAQELGAILISLNSDFADIVRYPPGNYRESLLCKLETTLKLFRNLWKD